MRSIAACLVLSLQRPGISHHDHDSPKDKDEHLPEPDIFDDLTGHVSMQTARHSTTRLTNITKDMSRFFWLTVEFGLMILESALMSVWR